MTGHLVFSTLHTNDAPSAITRLIDMGVKPFLVASSIQAILAQRLIRVICPECKEVYPDPDPKMLRLLGFRPDEIKNTTFHRGRGCGNCNGTGYRGRQGIFELMEMTNQLRELAFTRAPLSEIRKTVRSAGMKTLLDDGRLKIRNGVTTPEEVVRIAQVEDFAAE
ncbi:MAG TPA: ATPase, T2SS/T4P/T4SS family [Phycisphaerae bacterium]|nr:ATPase, T2SS/T4P/T4SS family [Phycisphaerae bacterium]